MYDTEQLEKSAYANAAALQAQSLKDQLTQELARTQANAARLQRLIGLLEAHPETQEILELLGRR